VAAAAGPATAGLSAIGDAGKPVDWWFIYKVAANPKPTGGAQVAKGDEYIYFDSEMARKAASQPVLSTHRIRDAQGALFATVGQLSGSAAKANRKLGWFCYNDEDRVDSRGEGQGPPWDCGHCKGMLAFDLATNTAFWLIHSMPLFPWPPAWQYRDGELEMGQTLLCITLSDAEAAQNIAQLMYDGHSPNVFLASDLLIQGKGQLYGYPQTSIPLTDVATLLGSTDARIQLMKNLNAAKSGSTKPYAGQVRFRSRGGEAFLAIAKNKAWDKDFYNDLVGVILNEDIDVETWERTTAIPPAQEPGEVHHVIGMGGVNLAPLKIPYSWGESNDHAKLAISALNNPPGSRWVCVGDINFTDSMEKRGGGTVAFQCDALWNSLSRVLTAPAASVQQAASAGQAPSAGQAAAPPAAPVAATGSRGNGTKAGRGKVAVVAKTVAAIKHLAASKSTRTVPRKAGS
jgi:deoxyribonuclease-2